MRRHHVASTLLRLHFTSYVICHWVPLLTIEKEIFSIKNGTQLQAAFHYQPPIVLLWQKQGRKIASHPSIHFFCHHIADCSQIRRCNFKFCQIDKIPMSTSVFVILGKKLPTDMAICNILRDKSFDLSNNTIQKSEWLCVLCNCGSEAPAQRAHGVDLTSYWHRCDVLTSHRFQYDFIST